MLGSDLLFAELSQARLLIGDYQLISEAHIIVVPGIQMRLSRSFALSRGYNKLHAVITM